MIILNGWKENVNVIIIDVIENIVACKKIAEDIDLECEVYKNYSKENNKVKEDFKDNYFEVNFMHR